MPLNHVNKNFVIVKIIDHVSVCVYPLIITCMFTSTGYMHIGAFLTVNTVMLS